MTLDLEIPWVEKYRPKNFEDIVSQSIAITNLKKFVESGDMPHMIFAGPAGTGKTSTALIIATKILKKENYYTDLLELNASDTVRMSYVRDVVKNFVNQNLIIENNNLKLIILDEADNIPSQVQQALRRIIEKASTRVKFILMCNYINNLIDPIISRCAVFRFVSLPKEEIIERLIYISKEENLKIPKQKEAEFFEILYFISEGDLRKAINTLQMSVALELVEDLDIDEILRISGFLDHITLNNLKKAFELKDFSKAKKILDSIEVYDCRNIIRQILELIPNLNLKPSEITNIMAFSGEIDFRISQGADEKIQLIAFIAEIINNL